MLFATIPSYKKTDDGDNDKKENAKFNKMSDEQKLEHLYG